ncbi:MAG: hypothetical protein CMJ58_13165 [Planctomycetaceae bacterium]|nr:hypothetical protein [Planctomycetaceae bacterium]
MSGAGGFGVRQLVIANGLALPGIGLAMLAKPMLWGEGAMLLGLALAFALPLAWVGSRPHR